MSGRREDDLSAIAWPGFVDILSAMIIMFIFFLMIVATALYFHILIFKSQVLAQKETEQIMAKSEEEVKVSQIQTEFAKSKEQKIVFNKKENTLIIFFGKDAISLLAENLEEIKEKMAVYRENKGANYNIRLEATKNPKTYENAARKVALARMLNVRNAIIQAGFQPEIIEPAVIEGEEIDDSYQWVRIIFEKQ